MTDYYIEARQWIASSLDSLRSTHIYKALDSKINTCVFFATDRALPYLPFVNSLALLSNKNYFRYSTPNYIKVAQIFTGATILAKTVAPSKAKTLVVNSLTLSALLLSVINKTLVKKDRPDSAYESLRYRITSDKERAQTCLNYLSKAAIIVTLGFSALQVKHSPSLKWKAIHLFPTLVHAWRTYNMF